MHSAPPNHAYTYTRKHTQDKFQWATLVPVVKQAVTSCLNGQGAMYTVCGGTHSVAHTDTMRVHCEASIGTPAHAVCSRVTHTHTHTQCIHRHAHACRLFLRQSTCDEVINLSKTRAHGARTHSLDIRMAHPHCTPDIYSLTHSLTSTHNQMPHACTCRRAELGIGIPESGI